MHQDRQQKINLLMNMLIYRLIVYLAAVWGAIAHEIVLSFIYASAFFVINRMQYYAWKG